MSEEQEKEIFREIRILSRQHVAYLWQLAQAGGEDLLSDEEAAMVQAMMEHTEYHDVWDRLDEFGNREIVVEGANPLLHVVMHGVVENQIRNGTPPEVAQVLNACVRRGMDRHELVHEIAALIATQLWEMMTFERPFDQDRYVRQLKALARRHRREHRRAASTGGLS